MIFGKHRRVLTAELCEQCGTTCTSGCHADKLVGQTRTDVLTKLPINRV